MLHHDANLFVKEPFDPLIQPFKVSGHTFTVDTRYSFASARIMGRGSFGIVTRAFDTIRGVNVAIKRVRPFAEDIWDAVHHLREIKIIKHFSFHPNIISLYNLSVNEAKKELYMYLELMDSDLAHIINSSQPLTEQHYKCFLKQILEGVSAMHRLNIFHRDLKPGNILLTKDCHIRIADLGLARYMHTSTLHGANTDKPMTHAVVTTWYRCLELLLAPNTMPYSAAVDMWSIGCIFAELLMRKAIFPGKNHIHQIQCIFHVVGHIPPENLGFPLTSDAKAFLKQNIDYQYHSWESLIPNEFATNDAISMLNSLLTVNPAKRITAKEALILPYLQDALTHYDYESISSAADTGEESDKQKVDTLAKEFFFEEENVSLSALQKLLQEEIALLDASAYRKPIAPPLSVIVHAVTEHGECYLYPKNDSILINHSATNDGITQAKIDESQSTTFIVPSENVNNNNSHTRNNNLTSRTRSGLTDHELLDDDNGNPEDEEPAECIDENQTFFQTNAISNNNMQDASYCDATEKVSDSGDADKGVSRSNIHLPISNIQSNNPFASPQTSPNKGKAPSCVSSNRRLRHALVYRNKEIPTSKDVYQQSLTSHSMNRNSSTNNSTNKWFHKVGMYRADTFNHTDKDTPTTVATNTNTTNGTFSTSLAQSNDSKNASSHLLMRPEYASHVQGEHVDNMLSFDETS